MCTDGKPDLCWEMALKIYMTKSCDSSVFHVNSFECLNVFLSKMIYGSI